MPSFHFRWGGSTAKRTINCPGWREEADKAPKLNRSNENAVRGSVLHACLDQLINIADMDPAVYLGQTLGLEDGPGEYTVTQEDVDEMEIALAAINVVMDKYGIDEFITEQLVYVDDETGGSADVIGCGVEWVLVADWKMGYTYVGAENNEQAEFYTWCGSETPETADMFKGKKIVLAIIQPKISDDADVYEVPDEEMDEFIAAMTHAIALAKAGGAPLNPGDWCEYCPAAAYCAAKKAQALKFTRLDVKQVADLVEGMAMVEAMKDQIKAIEAEVFAALENDEKVPGWKLVLKQARRSWIDEEVVELALRKAKIPEQVFTESKLLSVAQLEKALKKSKREFELDKFFTNKSSGTTLAPESDKRPAVLGKSQMPDALAKIMK